MRSGWRLDGWRLGGGWALGVTWHSAQAAAQPVPPTRLSSSLTPHADEVILPIRMAKYLGCHSALITNAAGGLNPGYKSGDLMLIEDHINLIGANPLRGPNPAEREWRG